MDKSVANYTTKFHIGMKVRILPPLKNNISQTGTIYNYLPSRPWPWHVLPDNYDDVHGIAFTEAEIESLEVPA